MNVAMIGLGRMGSNMARRLLGGGHRVVAYNRSPEKTREIASEGVEAAFSLRDLVSALQPPRVAWIMLPAGPAVDGVLQELEGLLGPGDIVVEGGNSHYRDDVRRAAEMEAFGVSYLDAGVSGGVWGLKLGYCLMVGGPEDAFAHVEPLLRTLAPEDGYLHCGPTGSGHFVKMVHNGIEYGLMQAYGEGFEVLAESPYGKGLDLAKVAALWNRGSVIRSWLLELAEEAFARSPRLEDVGGRVEDSGEGRWTVQEAVQAGIATPAIAAALFSRFASRREESFADKVVAALRREFGGHAVSRPAPRGRGKRT